MATCLPSITPHPNSIISLSLSLPLPFTANLLHSSQLHPIQPQFPHTSLTDRRNPRPTLNANAHGTPRTSNASRRGRPRKTKTPTSSPDPDSSGGGKPGSSMQEEVGDEGDYDDGIDFPYQDPPLICCFGAAQKEFVPTVRVSEEQMHPDIYSEWKMLQWKPPEFVRAPGGSPSNVAISHVRLGGRAAFMGKVGEDELGQELVLMMNKERVQTRAVKFDSKLRTACSTVRFRFGDGGSGGGGKMSAELVEEAAEDSLLSSELNLAVLKEVHFTLEEAAEDSLLSSELNLAVLKEVTLPAEAANWRSDAAGGEKLRTTGDLEIDGVNLNLDIIRINISGNGSTR